MNKLSLRTLYLTGFSIIVILLGITFYLQQYDGFIPCPLCILQRVVFILLGILFLVGSVFNLKKIGGFLLGVSSSLVALLGVFLSGRQVWLQHLPPDKNADCGVSLQYLMSVLPIDQVMSKILQGSAECAQKGWELLNLSLAEWSLVCFIGFFIFCLFQIKCSFSK